MVVLRFADRFFEGERFLDTDLAGLAKDNILSLEPPLRRFRFLKDVALARLRYLPPGADDRLLPVALVRGVTLLRLVGARFRSPLNFPFGLGVLGDSKLLNLVFVRGVVIRSRVLLAG